MMGFHCLRYCRSDWRPEWEGDLYWIEWSRNSISQISRNTLSVKSALSRPINTKLDIQT
jgi:hypothetical protein